jgi:hypothetical protein
MAQSFYGAYSNRAGAAIARADGDNADAAANTCAQQNNSDFSREARSTWARLLRKIFEVDPLVCKHLRNFERPTRSSRIPSFPPRFALCSRIETLISFLQMRRNMMTSP